MAEHKTFQGRLVQKHDTKANWDKATNFIPLQGEIIVYDDLGKIKIGDGATTVVNLAYVDKDVLHTSGDETASGTKTFSGKVNINGGLDIKSSGNAVLNIRGVSTTTDYADVYVSGTSNTKRPLVLQNNSSGSGNVGIGNATPDEKLTVNGNVKATKFKGDGSELTGISYNNLSDLPDMPTTKIRTWSETT